MDVRGRKAVTLMKRQGEPDGGDIEAFVAKEVNPVQESLLVHGRGRHRSHRENDYDDKTNAESHMIERHARRNAYLE
jgi:hypothetical protein